MTYTWKILCLTALATALVAGPRLRADDQNSDKRKPNNDDLTEVLKQINERLGTLDQKVGSLELLNQSFKGMQRDLKELKEQRPLAENRTRGIEEQLRILNERLDQMDRRLDRTAANTRQSNFQPAPGVNPTGTIVLQNAWTDLATVNLNGRLYNLLPGQTVTLVNQPVGDYTYDVSANGYGVIRGPVTRGLDANRALTIYVVPLR